MKMADAFPKHVPIYYDRSSVTWSRGYKKKFMLKSAEPEILNAHYA